MVRATGENPCPRANLEVRLRNPERGRHRKLRERLRLDAFHVVHNQTEAVSEIDHRSRTSGARFAGEDQARCLAFTHADTKEVDFQTRFLSGNQRANFQHMRLKYGTLLAIEIQRIIFQERAAARQTLVHHPYGAVESRRFPVAFCPEAISLCHQTLRSEARNLVEVASIRLAEVVEVCREAFSTLVLQDSAEGEFGLSRVPYLLVSLGRFVFQRGIVVVEAEVFLHQRLRILILDLAMIFHQLTDRTVIYVIAHANLGLHLVAIGNGYVIHLVAEAENQHILCIGPGSADAHPDGNFMLRLGILPIAHDHFAADTHTGADVSELAVAMSRLVEVHKVHVHRVPRNFAVELRMQMEERFLELLQSVNPHLRG